MADGRIVVDVGDDRRNKLKSLLYAKGQRIKNWVVEQIDKFIESEQKCTK